MVALIERVLVAEKIKKGKNNFMLQGQTASIFGNDPSVKGINRNSDTKDLKA